MSTLLRRMLALTAGAALVGLASVTSVASVSAATGPDQWQKAQVGLTYTVYQPMRTTGLQQTGFELNGCGAGLDDQINANLGSQSTLTTRWIGLNESQKPCQDGPDGVGPAATFTVRGATATVMGQCAGGKTTCPNATVAGVRKQAFTTVTLPSGGAGLSATYVEVYSQATSLAQIKAFVRGLQPVQ